MSYDSFHIPIVVRALTYHGLHADKEITPVQDWADESLVGAEPGAVPVICLSDRVANGILSVQISV